MTTQTSTPAAPSAYWSDRWAGVAPVLCAAHCLASPLLAATLPAFAVGSVAEALLFAVSALLSLAFVAHASRVHGQPLVWAPVLGGLLVWGAGLLGAIPALSEEATTTAGALALAAGLFWNGRLRHQATCRDCGCPAHGTNT